MTEVHIKTLRLLGKDWTHSSIFTPQTPLKQYTRSVQKVSSHAIWKPEKFIEEDIRYKNHCTQDNDDSAPLKVGTLALHTVLLIAISCPDVFSWISSMVWNLSPFKGDLFREKPKVTGHQIWAVARPSHLGNLMCKTWCVNWCVVVMKLPITS